MMQYQLECKKRFLWILAIILVATFYVNTAVSNSGPGSQKLDCESFIGPLVNKYFPNYTLVYLKDLDKDVQEYFKETYPNAHPGCIGEDFDGDGFLDYALLVKTKIKGKYIEKLIVLKGKGNKLFNPINLDEFRERYGSFFIRRVPPGKIKEWEETERSKMKTVVIKRPGFELVLFEAASRVYFWGNNKFNSIQTSD